MDLAADVATMVLKEIERDDGECPFVLTFYSGNRPDVLGALRIKGFVLKGELRFHFGYTDMVVKNPAALCFLIHASITTGNFTQADISKIADTSNHRLSAAHFFFQKIQGKDGDYKTMIENIVSAYIDVCKCN